MEIADATDPILKEDHKTAGFSLGKSWFCHKKSPSRNQRSEDCSQNQEMREVETANSRTGKGNESYTASQTTPLPQQRQQEEANIQQGSETKVQEGRIPRTVKRRLFYY